MRILSIEPTPSPHSMKLNVDERLPDGVRSTYTPENQEDAPEYAKRLLAIPGVAGLFRTADFIALDRVPSGDWQSILAAAREAIGGEADTNAAQTGDASGQSGYGGVQVLVQTFRHIPMQVRVRSGAEEQRSALPERFAKAAMEAGLASPNLIAERRLEERGLRYGELAEVLAEVVRELDAAYDEERLAGLVESAVKMSPIEAKEAASGNGPAERRDELSLAEAVTAMQSTDWRTRYAALQRLKPDAEAVPLLAKALDDPQMSIRRLAAVYLGDTKDPSALPYLFRALKDSAVAVRRTAGDTVSDLGDPAAIPAMLEALRDPSKLVRWRAARFLYEQGDESVLPQLKAAMDEAEFEVRMQIKLAIERIEGGEAATGSVWQQMTNRARD